MTASTSSKASCSQSSNTHCASPLSKPGRRGGHGPILLSNTSNAPRGKLVAIAILANICEVNWMYSCFPNVSVLYLKLYVLKNKKTKKNKIKGKHVQPKTVPRNFRHEIFGDATIIVIAPKVHIATECMASDLRGMFDVIKRGSFVLDIISGPSTLPLRLSEKGCKNLTDVRHFFSFGLVF